MISMSTPDPVSRLAGGKTSHTSHLPPDLGAAPPASHADDGEVDMAADQRKDESVPGVPGPSDIPTREPYRADNPETRNTRNGRKESPVDYSAVADEQRGAQETTPCCKTGGPLDLQCQLCSKSPTFWRRTEGES